MGGRARPKWEAEVGGRGRPWESEVGGHASPRWEAEVGGRGRPRWESDVLKINMFFSLTGACCELVFAFDNVQKTLQ